MAPSMSPWRLRAAMTSRLISRPASFEVSPASPAADKRSGRRRRGWAGETQSWASMRSTIFAAALARNLAAAAGAMRLRPRWARLVVGPWLSCGLQESQGRIQNFRGDQRQGPRPAELDGEYEVEHRESEDFGFGHWGVPEGEERQGGGLGRCRDRIPVPCASLQAGCEAVRVRQSQVEPGRRLAYPPRVEAGRSAGAVAPKRQRFAAGPRGSPTAKRRSRSAASSALTRRILAEAAAL
jgi:hypothetical protein